MEIAGATGALSGQQAAAMQKDTSDAQLVSKTIDRMNTNQVTGEKNQDHQFQTSVLQAGAIGKGAGLNKMV